ncbi:N-acetylglucosamine-1-phosphate uridyltransferase [Enhygromyxa salina]|uniref:N-acetylglucosamine-1-phosphate uridyltransferase n=1 Tax=Enhygromyxa salina TaxID=215803 RepID=A0A0C1ZL74_9BACT|nr:UDP-N-acetylglucosamine pyrophosphorylase [Enhygromyxa salina]KIG18279.1 N-acetylglucosamine-1-phosphate uridyltransferase [Enhygromyxa salina]
MSEALSDTVAVLEARLASLRAQGVTIVDPRQTFVGPEVDLDRVRPGAILHPGTRLQGARCFVGADVELGREGPAVIVDSALAKGAAVASGYVEGAVLLRGAKLGANAHVRPGTLLEEEASTAHCVGLKHTLLLSFVTLGSVINFCDCLMAGGTSRSDHSEVGSGFIHFNFTPWGERGDKATPSLVGDVVRGVFLREHRIFLGGLAGLVGPTQVGYGSVVGAGQIVRRDVGDGSFVLRQTRNVERQLRPGWTDRLQPRQRQNIAYIAQLFALREWYRSVRLARVSSDDPARIPVAAGAQIIDLAIAERRKQLERFLVERDGRVPNFDGVELPACPWSLVPDGADHIEWVQGLDDEQVAVGQAWLGEIVARVVAAAEL